MSETVVVVHTFAADGATIYDGFLDPEKAREFLFRTPAGTMVSCEIEARVGGHFFITEKRDGEDVLHTGEYLELVRPERIVFTFGVPKYSREFTTVSLDIVPIGEGCEVTLTHTGVLAEWAEGTAKAWAGILDGAERILA